MSKTKIREVERRKFRDGVSALVAFSDDYARIKYQEDRDVIGSPWMAGENYQFLRPSVYEKDEFTLIARYGHRMIMRRLNGQLIQCYDSGHNGHSVIAHGLIPVAAYDYDNSTGIFKPNPKSGTVHIQQDKDGYFTTHWNEYGDPVYIGRHQWFYRTPQGDINKMAAKGFFGPPFNDPVAPKEKKQKVIRFCQTCGSLMDQTTHHTVKFCSVPCGLPDPAITVKKKAQRQADRAAAATKRALKKLIGSQYQCVECGTSFTRKTQGNHRLCSDECREKHFAYKKRVRTIDCKACGNAFEFHGCGNPRFCSDECRRTVQGYKARERTIRCDHCSINFTVTGQGKFRFCSDRCRAGEGPRFPLPRS